MPQRKYFDENGNYDPTAARREAQRRRQERIKAYHEANPSPNASGGRPRKYLDADGNYDPTGASRAANERRKAYKAEQTALLTANQDALLDLAVNGKIGYEYLKELKARVARFELSWGQALVEARASIIL